MPNQDFYNFYKKNRGQAAVELAIFGSLILLALGVFVRYGLRANYSQKLKMDSYTTARAEMGGNAQKTTYIMLRDKPIPNPSDPFGVASRDSVFFSSESMGRRTGVFDSPDYPEESEELLTSPQLPLLIYDINGTIYKFTTAAFKYCPYYDNQELKRKDYHDDGTWYWRTSVSPDRTEDGVDYEYDEAMEFDGDFWAGLVGDDTQGKLVDMDEDGEEELVLKINALGIPVGDYEDARWEHVYDCEWNQQRWATVCKVYEPGDDVEYVYKLVHNFQDEGFGEDSIETCEIYVSTGDDYNYEVKGFYVLDYQEGQIDVTDKGPDGQRQGLQSLSRKNLELIDCSIRREEDNSQIKSTTKTEWQQDITRYIIVNPRYVNPDCLNEPRLKEGDNILPGLPLSYGDIDGDGEEDWYVNIKSDFSEDKTLQWSATHASE